MRFGEVKLDLFKNRSIARILSFSSRPFTDRQESGSLLAQELLNLKGKKAVVLGIPRGGVAVARAIAQALDADIDIIISRKLATPWHQELAMGAVSEDGDVIMNRNVVDTFSIPDRDIQQEKNLQIKEIQRRSQLIRGIFPRVPLQGRTAIVTDDGVATGATMQAALWTVRKEKPRRLIAAIPVASEEAITRIIEDVDELVCLRMPPDFEAVGQFYTHFEQISDQEVLAILKQEKERMDKL
jgi:putative phosphoribosyl transferase